VLALAALVAVLAPLALDAEPCPRGSLRENGACVAVPIPENAELDQAGADFVCHRGYRREGDACRSFAVPEHAELDASGHDFRCRRGFRRVNDRCEAFMPPPNGKLDVTGNDWGCRRGYQRRGAVCATLRVPENAVLDATGNDWTCVRGYRAQDGRCTLVTPPRYAVLDASGHGWVCKDGFEPLDDQCTPLSPQELRARAAIEELESQTTSSRASAGAEIQDPRSPLGYEVEGYCGERYVTGLMFPADDSEALEGTLYSEEGRTTFVQGTRRPPDSVTITGFDDTGNACLF